MIFIKNWRVFPQNSLNKIFLLKFHYSYLYEMSSKKMAPNRKHVNICLVLSHLGIVLHEHCNFFLKGCFENKSEGIVAIYFAYVGSLKLNKLGNTR
jgi:hypothetical protein